MLKDIYQSLPAVAPQSSELRSSVPVVLEIPLSDQMGNTHPEPPLLPLLFLPMAALTSSEALRHPGVAEL